MNVILPDEAIGQLHTYYSLLAKWNSKINLTSLILDPPTDAAFDRLLIEPLAAAQHVPDAKIKWFDFGSGGGSPALPLKIVRPSVALVMVESKARKCAFLGEAVRVLGLDNVRIENLRFEELVARSPVQAQLITVRAVRADAALAQAASQLLTPDGHLLLFRPNSKALSIQGFKHIHTTPLIESGSSFLSVYARMFHVEQQ